jgi:hypothetical protein
MLVDLYSCIYVLLQSVKVRKIWYVYLLGCEVKWSEVKWSGLLILTRLQKNSIDFSPQANYTDTN